VNYLARAEESAPLLALKGIHKRFEGVYALNDVSLTLWPGEIVGLVGENGAGKSTLMKVLMGIERPNEGEIHLRGVKTSINSPAQAYLLGIGMVFQEQALLGNMRVYENMFLGHEMDFLSFGILVKQKMVSETKRIMKMLDVDIDPYAFVEDLDYAKRQMIEIAKCLYMTDTINEKAIIVLDEPTTVISRTEVAFLFQTIKKLQEKASFIFISHNLREVLTYADRVYVLKDGKNVDDLDLRLEPGDEAAKTKKLQEMMVGRLFSKDYFFVNNQNDDMGEVTLRLKNVCGRNIEDISFSLREGEILGVSGLMGCGKETIPRVILGDEPINSGNIRYFEDDSISVKNIVDAVKSGIGYIPSDRRNEGVFEDQTLLRNITISALKLFCTNMFIDADKERRHVEQSVRQYDVKTASIQTLMRNLSGGNQQKVVLCRWLMRDCRLLMMDQPTRGIDVGAKQEIYRCIRDLAGRKLSIIVISDELNELIGLSNKVLVMKNGRIAGTLDCPKNHKPDEREIIKYMYD